MSGFNFNFKKTVNNKNDNKPVIFVIVVLAFIALVSIMMAINDVDPSLSFFEKVPAVFWSAIVNFAWGLGISIFFALIFFIFDYCSKKHLQ